jgi:hypothetical protein
MITGVVPEAKCRAGADHTRRRPTMSDPSAEPISKTEPPPATAKPSQPPPADAPKPDGELRDHTEGFGIEVGGEEDVDRRLATIEMAGEEVAAGWKPTPHEPLSPEVRYLHISRTIHQLITDRNRSVGIFLFLVSVFFGASTALLNAPATVVPIVPLKAIQYWCLPVTFGTLALIGAFMSLILIRTRIGLIYEVSKMNALLGLPTTRVKRVNPLSIFFLMHLLVVVLGGASAGLAAGMLRRHLYGGAEVGGQAMGVAAGVIVGIGYLVVFQVVYYVTILLNTKEDQLGGVRG